MIYIGSDHRGFALKEKIKAWLAEWNYQHEDLGANNFDPNDDYTTFAEQVAKKIQSDKSSFGILLCGSGVGVDIAANKFDGIRASMGKSSDQVKAGRNDDDINVLVIASDFTNENEAKDMVKIFLETKFDEADRHIRRLTKIKEIEKNN